MKAIRRFYLVVVIQSALLTMAPAALRAQDETPDGYVTRKEYEELKTQLLAMKKELDTLKKEREVAPRQKDRESQSVADTAPKRETAEGQAIADVHKQVAPEVTLPVVQPEGLLGTTKFLLAGWADGMFEARNGQVSTFSASFDPIFLWELTPKISFDSRLEIDPSGGGTNVNLVNACYLPWHSAKYIRRRPGARRVSDRLDPRGLRLLCFQRSCPEYFRRSPRGYTGFQQLHR